MFCSIRPEIGILLHGKYVKNELPEAVKNTINNQYGEYRFDEAKRIEKADGTIYYRIELEKMNVDLEVNINEDGIVIP